MKDPGTPAGNPSKNLKTMTTMKTFELLVTKDNADEKGIATIPSMLSQITGTMEECREDAMTLRNTVFELFERPKVDDIYNLTLVESRKTSKGSEEKAIVTDQDGHEIGCCTSEWSTLAPDQGMRRPDSTEYIRKFFKLLPDEICKTGLSIRLELRFHEEPLHIGDISYRLMTPRSDTYLFSVGTGDNIICTAALTTE